MVCGHSADTEPMAEPERLTETAVKELGKPPSGNRITYDPELKGFGVRVTSAGAKAFVLNYRAGGRERRYTIGSWPDWKVAAARDEAKRLKKLIDVGEDPMAERHEQRAAPTINELADRFEAEHLSKRRFSTARDYRSMLKLYIRPRLGRMKVADVRHADVERLHAFVARAAPVRANRVVALLSKMLNLSIKWEMRSDNPVEGLERTPEERRERYLSPEEIERLAEALAAYPERASVSAIRLILLTGARRGETLAAKWSEISLEPGAEAWSKPSAHTKTKRNHKVPLSEAAVALLTEMKAAAETGAVYLFPSDRPAKDEKGHEAPQPISNIKRAWAAVCQKAGLGERVAKLDTGGRPLKDRKGNPVTAWKADARVHDLRHTYASILASSGHSLPIIGALLGHTQAATTNRYAHIMDNPLRAATERVGKAVMAGTTKQKPGTPE